MGYGIYRRRASYSWRAAPKNTSVASCPITCFRGGRPVRVSGLPIRRPTPNDRKPKRSDRMSTWRRGMVASYARAALTHEDAETLAGAVRPGATSHAGRELRAARMEPRELRHVVHITFDSNTHIVWRAHTIQHNTTPCTCDTQPLTVDRDPQVIRRIVFLHFCEGNHLQTL